VRKDRFYTSGGSRALRFTGAAVGDIAQLKSSGKTLTISIGPGLPKNASECPKLLFALLLLLLLKAFI